MTALDPKEARAQAESWLKRLDGDSDWARSPEQRERIDHERGILRALLGVAPPEPAASVKPNYETDAEYRAAKHEIANALTALDRMDRNVAEEYLKGRLSRLNDEQIRLGGGDHAE